MPHNRLPPKPGKTKGLDRTRTPLAKVASGREIRQLSKSALESVRYTRHRSTAQAPALRTQKPYHAMRGRGMNERTVREGQGDFRYVGNVALYRTRRNGIPRTGPEFVPYVYGASVGSKSWELMDHEAIELADAEFDHRNKAGRAPNTALHRHIMQLHAENPGMTYTRLADVAGCSLSMVSKLLRRTGTPPRRTPVQRGTGTCQQCGREAIMTAGQKFCSNACKQKDKRIRQAAARLRAAGLCPDCGYWLTSSEHRLTCLAAVPDAEPPQEERKIRKVRPQDAARIRGAA